MQLADYPRPKNDTGLGIHWSAGPAGAVPLQEVRTRWLPELQAMNIKWVKVLHDGAEDLCELLLAHDIMPIVRLYRFQPNPGRLSADLIERLKRFIAIGVRYFEVNNEPNLVEEWQPGEWQKAGEHLPILVTEAWIADAETVLELGGLPAYPALTPGGHWDDIDFLHRSLRYLAEKGRADLFEQGGWLPVHNYFLNHPHDYPYDRVNQFGVPVSPEEAAQHRFAIAIEEVNRHRLRGRAPGRTLRGDSNGFLKYRIYRDIFVEYFGFEVPILTTEGGVVMGRAQDPRYPIVDEALHTACNLFGFTHMADAPDYYFCNCPWLIANAEMHHNNPHWEESAWYSPRWPNGQLPIVQAVKERAPWPVRLPRTTPTDTLTLTVHNGEGQVVVLRRPSGDYVSETVIGADERAHFEHVAHGTYTAEVVGTRVQTEPLTVPGDPPPPLTVPPRLSAIEGELVNAPPIADLTLFVQDEGFERVERRMRITTATFAFERLWAGTYRLVLEQNPHVHAGPITLDGRERRRVRLVVPQVEWQLDIENPSGAPTAERRSRIIVHTPGLRGRRVSLEAPWALITVPVGNKPDIDPDAAVIENLPAATYRLHIADIPGDIVFTLDGVSTAHIHVREVLVEPIVEQGHIRGRVVGAPHTPVRVLLLRDNSDVIAETHTDESGAFAFDALPAGRYTVHLPLFDLRSEEIAIGGDAPWDAETTLTVPTLPTGRISGRVRNVATHPIPVLLEQAGRVVAETMTDPQGNFLFEELADGEYTIFVPAIEQRSAPIRIDHEQAPEVHDVELTAPPPALSRIRGRVENAPTPPVRLILQRDGVNVAETASDAQGHFVFEELPPGAYRIALPDLNILTKPLTLDGRNEVQIRIPVPPATTKALDTYVWLLADAARAGDVYTLALPLIQRHGWAFGFDAEAARLARRVVVIGTHAPPSTEGMSIAARAIADDMLTLAERVAALEETL